MYPNHPHTNLCMRFVPQQGKSFLVRDECSRERLCWLKISRLTSHNLTGYRVESWELDTAIWSENFCEVVGGWIAIYSVVATAVSFAEVDELQRHTPETCIVTQARELRSCSVFVDDINKIICWVSCRIKKKLTNL